MEIDIIDYTASQYAGLTSVALEKIRSAQRKKNELTEAFEEKCRKRKQKMMDNGSFLSNIWARDLAQLTQEYEAGVEALRTSLLFYLQYAGDLYVKTDTTSSVPYEVNYSYTEDERILSVKAYYLEAYSIATERFSAFDADTFAKSYLGEGYAPLWHYFKELITE